MKQIEKENRGGKRIGAGRKPAPYKTKVITFRVRVHHAEEIKNLVITRKQELESNDLLSNQTR